MPVGEAFAGPWLCIVACELVLKLAVPVVVVEGRVVVVAGPVVVIGGAFNTLSGLAFIVPVGEAFIEPWLCMPAAAPAPAGGPPALPPPCACANAGAAMAMAVLATAAMSELRNIILSMFVFV
jgi:hypothetical protein